MLAQVKEILITTISGPVLKTCLLIIIKELVESELKKKNLGII